jgi:nitric oxide reductase NorD protein
MPDALDDIGDVPGLEVYRATAAHMAAHMSYTFAALSAEELSPAQMSFIGLLEDARIEYKAIQDFPGLKKLWTSLLSIEHEEEPEHPTIVVLERLALMLLDASVRCDRDELNEFADQFHQQIAERQDDPQFSWHMGLELFNYFSARKEVPSLRILERIRLPYRDDNRFVWEFAELTWDVEYEYVPASQRQVRRQVSVIEMANEVGDCL